jgi:hypothetical protein
MDRRKNYDVIVVGGGSAGVSAAIGAAKAGASCLLIERNGSLGGHATNANVSSYCGFFTRGEKPTQVVKGIGEEVLHKLNKLDAYDGFKLSPMKNAIVILDTESTKFALDELVSEYCLDVLLHCRVVKANMNSEKARIVSIECVDDEGFCEYSAQMFVDASGDANLGYLAGADYRWGNGNGGSQLSTMVMRIDRVDPSVSFSPELLEKIILQAKEEGYNQLSKESGIVVRISDDTVVAVLPSVEVSSLDSVTLTKCEMDTRLQCQKYMEVFKKYIPGMEKSRLVWTGNYLGLRDTRHLVGTYTLTGDDVINAKKHEDVIARGGWPCEMHVEKNKMAQYLWIKDDSYYEIPLGCLKPIKIENLWAAGRTISADPIAFASVRVMGIGFATGHAAGVAAALTINGKSIDIKKIQEELRRQNALI